MQEIHILDLLQVRVTLFQHGPQKIDQVSNLIVGQSSKLLADVDVFKVALARYRFKQRILFDLPTQLLDVRHLGDVYLGFFHPHGFALLDDVVALLLQVMSVHGADEAHLTLID